jgi:hydrogenase maturation protease
VPHTGDLRDQLRQCLQGRTCLIALGNSDYHDDGFGVRLGEELVKAGMPDVVIAGTTPDRCISGVAEKNFDRILFLDAVEFGAAPGSVVLLNAKEMTARYPQVSTHKISVGVLAKWVESSSRTRVWLLGVQPESMKVGHELTPTVNATLELLRDLLLTLKSGAGHVGADADVRPAGQSSDAKTREDSQVTV